jgi:hypothetical protein
MPSRLQIRPHNEDPNRGEQQDQEQNGPQTAKAAKEPTTHARSIAGLSALSVAMYVAAPRRIVTPWDIGEASKAPNRAVLS